MNRRDTLKLLGSAPAALAFTWSVEEASAAAQEAHHALAQAAAANVPYTPRFFTADEYAAVIALADLIIPKDGRSGSASEAGAPEFIDFLISQQVERQTAIRGGLRWLDTECRGRFDKNFLTCSDAERRAVLDDIAWPARATRARRQGARFFSTMRDLVATGFWSSKIGVADLGYLGNRPSNWDGPPAAVLQKLGLTDA
jgi:gluconate 2-dehydrogenase gamma chain